VLLVLFWTALLLLPAGRPFFGSVALRPEVSDPLLRIQPITGAFPSARRTQVFGVTLLHRVGVHLDDRDFSDWAFDAAGVSP